MPNLFIDVEARFAQFRDALDSINRSATKSFGGIERSLQGLNKGFATLGVGLSVAGLAAYAKSAVDAVAALDDLAEKTSLSVETISSLREVAIIGGHSLDGVAASAGKFAKSVSGALGGNQELLQQFKQIGISAGDLKNKTFDEVFVKFATNMAGATDKTNALALATKLAGKSAAEQIPFFNDLAERGLQAATVTGEMAAQAEKVQKNFKELSLRSQEARDSLVSTLLPGLIRVSEVMKEAAKNGDNLLVVMAKAAKATFFGDEQLQRDKETVELLNQRLFLEKQMERVAKPKPFQSQETRDKLVAELRAEILKIDARMEALRKIRDANDAANKPGDKPAGITVGPVIDRGELEKAKREAEAAAKALDGLREARSKIAIDSESDLAKRRLAVLDHFYKEGFISEQHFWQARAEVQQAAYQIERKAITDNIAFREAAVSRALKEHGAGSKEYHDATKDLAVEQAKRNKLDEEFSDKGTQDFLSREKATRDYENAIKGVNAQLEELNGNTAEATRMRLALQNQTLRAEAGNRGKAEDLSALETLERRTLAQAKFNQFREQAEQTTARLAIEEERIQNSLRTGAIGEQEALRRTEIARRNALNTLALTKQQLDAIAHGEDGFEKLRLSAEQFGLQLETLASQSNLLQDQARELFEGAVVDGWKTFRDELQRSGKVMESLGKAFERFALRIIDKIQDIQAANLAKAIMGEGGAAGGAIGLLMKLLGLGGGGGIDTGGIVIDPVDTGPGYFTPSYAVGTSRVSRTGLALVHEGEKITPANESGSGVTYAPTFNVDSRTDRAEIIALMRKEDARTVDRIADLTRRGGAYKRAVRGG